MLYLASQSPQRRQLLHDAGIAFQCVASSCNEEAISETDPLDCAAARARGKARAAILTGINLKHGDAVLGADTLVILHQQMIGKPADRDHARQILQQLQGSSHIVATAHCLWQPAMNGETESLHELIAQTHVQMRAMSTAEIERYVDSGESDGRAGAYAIQEHGDAFVAGLDGDFDTVVGLNLATVRKLCQQAGVSLGQ
jgi:septum formation protein